MVLLKHFQNLIEIYFVCNFKILPTNVASLRRRLEKTTKNQKDNIQIFLKNSNILISFTIMLGCLCKCSKNIGMMRIVTDYRQYRRQKLIVCFWLSVIFLPLKRD
jgi:hypothetical protein